MSAIEGTYQGFEVEIRDPGIAVITFTEPARLNAMGSGTRRDVVEVLNIAQLDDAVRVVVFTATGRGFLAGVSNQNRGPGDPTLVPPIPTHEHVPVDLYGRLRLHAQELPRTVRRLDKFSIAAVNGFAIQLGLSLVLACDFAIAADRPSSAAPRCGWAGSPTRAGIGCWSSTWGSSGHSTS